MSEQHETSIRYSTAHREYVPDCTCGWTGSYVKTEKAAVVEASEHQDAEGQSKWERPWTVEDQTEQDADWGPEGDDE